MASNSHVVIIGAGVIGLSCALQLGRKGIKVTVLATHVPGDWDVTYASPRAGAHFRPVPIKSDQDAFENKLMRESYDEFKHLAIEERSKSAGVQFIPALEYFDKELASQDLEMFAAWPGFRLLNADELPKVEGVKAGLTYDAWVLNSPVYLKWLQSEAEKHGVLFAKHTLSAVEEAVFVASGIRKDAPQASVVINATGMGFDDKDCFPSRGQFLLVKNVYDKTVSHHSADGHSTVIIPRPLGGGSVIGGTKEPRNWSTLNSPAAIDQIKQRILAICPDLLSSSEPELVLEEAYIGRRPMRQGGLRLESEHITIKQTSDNGLTNHNSNLHVIHCYGAGPSGYKIGWGAATRVTAMVMESI